MFDKNINDTAESILFPYENYRKNCQLLCNIIMNKIKGYQVYLIEHDINVFCLNFCSIKDRKYDCSFILTLDQLQNIHCVLENIIIPELNIKKNCTHE